MKNLKFIRYLWSWCAISMLLCACSDEPESTVDGSDVVRPVDMTLFMYMPWSQNLTSDLTSNLLDMQQALKNENIPDKRVLAFISTSASEAQLVEITNGEKELLKTYAYPDITSSDGIADILIDVKSLAPATKYAMTIGCHGTGWIPAGALEPYRKSKYAQMLRQRFPEGPKTRYFGGIDLQWQTDVSTLVRAMESSETHLEFLMFDACYMGGVEVAYELRNVANVTVLSPTEVMGVGMPYKSIGTLLLADEVDWQTVCTRFHDFFMNYPYPCGTLSVIDSSKLTSLATSMREINRQHKWNNKPYGRLQSFGGFYGQTVFFDLGQYVDLLSEGNDIDFRTTLSNAVIASTHTGKYYVALQGTYPISHYSGLSCSAPSISPITIDWPCTQWALDTAQ